MIPASPVKTEPRFWQLPVAALLENLNSSPSGLSSKEAALRLAHFGPNLIHAERKRALILQFLAKFRNPLVIIRTRKNPFKSRPNPWLITCSLTVVAVAVLLPFTPVGAYLGFVAPPAFFFLILTAMLLAYLLAVEGMKQWFFRRFAAE